MNAHALLALGFAQGWCLILVTSFFGWGHAALAAATGRVRSAGLAILTGMTIAVFIGGILNLLHGIMPVTLFGFVLIGVGLAVRAAWRRDIGRCLEVEIASTLFRQSWPWKRLALAILCLVFVSRAIETTRALYLPQDDENFYLAMPVKMLQMHHYAADPLSERRIESSLGASYFLQCFTLCVLPYENIQMPDRWLGLVVLVLLLFALGRYLGLSPPDLALLGILAIVLTPPEFNLTFAMIPSAFVLALILAALDREAFAARPVFQPFLIGSLCGALVAMKTTVLPFAGLICLALAPPMAGRGRTRWLTGWLASLVGALLVLAPWMYAMKETSGTFFYPIFGSGYDFSAYPQFPHPFHAPVLAVLKGGATFYLPLLVILFAQVCLLRQARSQVLLAAVAACLLSSLAIAFATGGDDSQRYNATLVFPTIVIALIQFSKEHALRPGWRTGALLRWSFVALLVGWIGLHVVRGRYSMMAHEFWLAVTNQPSFSPSTLEEYAKLDRNLPKDGIILATLQDPFLLPHLDEHILLCDYPGCAGPPPGWPIGQSSEVMVRYLQDHSVRYVAYSFADNQQLDYCLTHDIRKMSVRSQVQFGSYLEVDRLYRELRRSRKVLYDDGKIFVLDLKEKATPQIGAEVVSPKL